MSNKRNVKILICCLFLAALVLATAAAFLAEQQYCMGVPLTTSQKLTGLTEVSDLDLGQLSFGGEPVAADLSSNTVYISQASDKIHHYSALEGTLTAAAPACELYFLKDDALTDPAASVQNGTPLTLVMVEGDRYQKVKVVLTTLPVLSMTGQPTEMYNEGRQIFSGSVTLWSGKDPGTDSYTVQSSQVQWHLRGATSSLQPKKPWKLSLKDSSGSNADLNFLDLGADDDWILNPMNMDDTKVREKLCTELWNQYIYTCHDGYPMSACEYIEVIINNQYQGLYLLQRRVDAKYLQLDQQADLLFKCIGTYENLGIRKNYETIFSPFDTDATYSFLENALSNANGSTINLESYLDVSLLIQYLALFDNQGYKNMFYILRSENDGCAMYFVPWDTDMSMGLTFTDFFIYDYQSTITRMTMRMEQPAMLSAYPQLETLLTERWWQLRSTVYTEENLNSLLADNIGLLQSSGALNRDIEKWELQYGGQDTHTALYQWCRERLQILDESYGK